MVATAGDYFVDQSTGRFKSFSALGLVDKIDYTVDSSSWNITTATLPSVIPDPRQQEFRSCRVSTDSGKFYIHLPPRRPLALSGFERPERYPTSTSYSDNEATSTSIPRKLWQSSSVSALQDAHYRYSLPKEVLDVLGTLSVGDRIPEGFIFLWDKSLNTIVEGVTFKKSSFGDWIFEITSDVTDITPKVTSSEIEASYNSTNYIIITVGSPITRTLWTLTNALLSGDHTSNGALLPILNHSALQNSNPPPSTYSGHGSRYPSTVPAWAPSRWAMDDHISLLSRAGSQGTSSSKYRDVNDNAMLGDLVMASSFSSSGNYLNFLAASRKIYFGKLDSNIAPNIGSLLGGTEIRLDNGDFLIGDLSSDLDSIIINVSTGINGFGLGSTDTPAVFAVSVFDAEGKEHLSSVRTNSSLSGGKDEYTISISNIPSWAKKYRLYEHSTDIFTGTCNYWEITGSNNGQIFYGNSPGDDSPSSGTPVIIYNIGSSNFRPGFGNYFYDKLVVWNNNIDIYIGGARFFSSLNDTTPWKLYNIAGALTLSPPSSGSTTFLDGGGITTSGTLSGTFGFFTALVQSTRTIVGIDSIVLSNGNNNNITAPTVGFYRITGPTGAFTITGITAMTSGSIIYISNTTNQTMTISNQSGSSSAANQIITGSGTDLTVSGATLIYDGVSTKWRLISS